MHLKTTLQSLLIACSFAAVFAESFLLKPKGSSSPENGSFVAGRTWDGSFVATLT